MKGWRVWEKFEFFGTVRKNVDLVTVIDEIFNSL